jgi:predicted Zn-dependent protease with MMP-like domain
LLERQIGRVVLHEVAHQFGVIDQRLIEPDRY